MAKKLTEAQRNFAEYYASGGGKGSAGGKGATQRARQNQTSNDNVPF